MIFHTTVITCDGCIASRTINSLATPKYIKRVYGWVVRRDKKTFCGNCRDAKKHLPECCFCGTKNNLDLCIDPMNDFGTAADKDYMCTNCYQERMDEV